MYAFKLNPIFVYQRIVIYLCYLICQSSYSLSKFSFPPPLLASISNLLSIYSLLLNVNIYIYRSSLKHKLQSQQSKL